MESLIREKFIWDDAIWGKTFDGKKHVPAKSGFKKGQQGQNKLGKMLVKIRGEIAHNPGVMGSEPAYQL